MSRKAIIEKNDRLREFLERFRTRNEPPPSRTKVRYRNRCSLCGRPRGYIRYVGLCRICFRELVHKGYLPGFRKASW